VFFVPEPDLLVPPYTDPLDAEWTAYFPAVEGDSVTWTDCDPVFEGLGPAEARALHAPEAERLYLETVAEIERWARYAPEQARPREEWAGVILWWRSRMTCHEDTAVSLGLTREALGHHEAALALTPDTSLQQRIDLSLMRLAAGQASASEMADEVDSLVSLMGDSRDGRYSVPSWTAANVYLAAGQPAKAIDRMRGIWVEESRSTRDPIDRETRYDYGDVFQQMGEIRVLGAVGALGPRLDRAIAEVNWAWAAPRHEDPERRRAVLRRSSAVGERSPTADIRPALALDGDARDTWFADWGDLADTLPDVWRGFLAVDSARAAGADSVAAAAAGRQWLAAAVEHVEAMERPFAADLFITGLLAQRVGDHARAASLFGRVESCPLKLRLIDVGWGLSRLSSYYRARSLEALGRHQEAAAERQWLAGEWSAAEPECAARVERRLAQGPG
jgi:hypothetical protein